MPEAATMSLHGLTPSSWYQPYEAELIFIVETGELNEWVSHLAKVFTDLPTIPNDWRWSLGRKLPCVPGCTCLQVVAPEEPLGFGDGAEEDKGQASRWQHRDSIPGGGVSEPTLCIWMLYLLWGNEGSGGEVTSWNTATEQRGFEAKWGLLETQTRGLLPHWLLSFSKGQIYCSFLETRRNKTSLTKSPLDYSSILLQICSGLWKHASIWTRADSAFHDRAPMYFGTVKVGKKNCWFWGFLHFGEFMTA